MPVDVADPEQVDELARRVLDEFGAVHVLCNNAGVNSPDEPIWEVSQEDWAHVIDINLRGVVHGIHSFLPHMLAQDSEGHIVNTASAAGLGSRPGISPYVATKHAVIALTESLHHDLRAADSKLRASVLCPGRIRTPMMAAHLEREGKDAEEAAAGYLLPSQVGELVLDSIRDERFYILTHPEGEKDRVRGAADDILLGRDPTHSPPIH